MTNNVRFEAKHANGHTFSFDATEGHESVAALRSIGFMVTPIARLVYRDTYVKAFGGVYLAHDVATWVDA